MFVVDCSLVLSWCFEDEFHPAAWKILLRLQEGAYALAPALFPFEVANALEMARRSNRISSEEVSEFLLTLNCLRIVIDQPEPAMIYQNLVKVARDNQLSVYDAAYLELAIRDGCPLATLDTKLQSVAKKLGVKILGR